MGCINVVIVCYGGLLNLRGGASIGDIMAFQWYVWLLLGPVWNIVNTFSELQRSLAAMERVFEILGLPADKPDRPGAGEAPRTVREIRFEGVSFEHREGQPVVKDFSATVSAGSVIALSAGAAPGRYGHRPGGPLPRPDAGTDPPQSHRHPRSVNTLSRLDTLGARGPRRARGVLCDRVESTAVAATLPDCRGGVAVRRSLRTVIASIEHLHQAQRLATR